MIDQCIITARLGNIVQQPDCNAVVNAANSRLRAGCGVCGAIHAAAGPELEPFAINLAPVPTGGAVITPGFRMSNPWIIHAVGPRYLLDPDPHQLLAQAMSSIIRLAEDHGLARIAVPAISTGVYGYPMDEAAPVLVQIAREAIANGNANSIQEIRFVLTSQAALSIFLEAIEGVSTTPIISRRLIEAIRDHYALEWSGIHGASHWSRVRLNGLELARHTGADTTVVELFAFLHDSCRHNEGRDPMHGARAADFISRLQGEVFELSAQQLSWLMDACAGHTGGEVARNPTIATCWDADRLDLWRIGVQPDPAQLLTAAAKDPKHSAAALARVRGDGQNRGSETGAGQ